MLRTLCVCDAIPTLPLSTRIVVVAHHREVDKTTATGPLAVQALPSASLHVHGLADAPLDLSPLRESGRRVLVLFPGEVARPLSPALLAEDPRPVTLIVPEGNWRQASRMARRLPGLAGAEHVVLPPGPPTRWGVRTETRDGGLCTLEAIARAVGILESPEAQAQLEALLDLVVARTLWSRQPTGERCPW